MNRQKHLETILVLVIALGIAFWMVHVKKPALGSYFLISAFLLGIIGVFIPYLAAKIHWLWMKLAHVMGAVMSKVILSIVYCVIVLPMALLVRAFGKTGIKRKEEGESYYTQRNQEYTKESMENVW